MCEYSFFLPYKGSELLIYHQFMFDLHIQGAQTNDKSADLLYR
jgi:hypothetical protein